MAQTKNQIIEQNYFECFRKAFNLPNGLVEYGDKPDVIINGKLTTGIEITNYYIQSGNVISSEQKQRSLRKTAIKSAHKRYLSKGGKNIELTLSFATNQPILKVNTLIDHLTKVAKEIENSPNGPVPTRLFSHIPEISTIYISSEINNPQWHDVQCYESQSISQDRIRSIIRSKEEKSKEYKKADAYWLLIVVDFMDPAQDVDIDLIDTNNFKSSVFEQIMVYKPQLTQVVELS